MEHVLVEGEIKLTSISIDDIENLRNWKNENKDFFFLDKEITIEKQKKWYENIYLKDENNYIFIITYGFHTIGTIGCRLINDKWDIYNVMNISNSFKGKGIMSIALKLLIDFTETIKISEISAKVLVSNLNLNWYLKNRFVVSEKLDNYYLIKYIK